MTEWKSYLRERLCAADADPAAEADSIEELAQHLADCEASALERGATPEEAREQALAEIPDLAAVREEIRNRRAARPSLPVATERAGLAGLLVDVGRDTRYALRMLARAPGFAAVAILTLALGIGANSAVFSLLFGVAIEPLPYPEADRLVGLFHVEKGERSVMSPPNFLDLRAQSRTLETAAAYTEEGFTLTGRGEPLRLRGARVTDQFFQVLGVHPYRGRTLRPDDNRPGHTQVVVLGFELWRERLGGNDDIVGSTVILDGAPHTVAGIMPAGFAWPASAQLWAPCEYDAVFTTVNRGGWYLEAIGRLKRGASLAAAAAEASAIAARLAVQYPASNTKLGFAVVPLQEALVGDTRTSLLVLLGAVAFVLLIACVNVANLLLARASSRAHEIAMRAALGAGRARVARQLMTESVVLAALGSAAGIVVGRLLARGFVAFAPEGIPRLDHVTFGGPVVAFTFAVAVAATLAFGAAPAWRMSRVNLADTLKAGARGVGAIGGSRVRGVLVVAETALAVALLVGAALLVASFARLQRVDPGFERRGVLTFRLALPETVYKDHLSQTAFYDRLLSKLRALPGVTDAAASLLLPLSGDTYVFSFTIERRPPFEPGEEPVFITQVVTPGYFRTLGIPLVRGRLFTQADTTSSRKVMLVSESAARKFFPGEDPIGKRIRLGWRMGGENAGGEIVGIVRDVKEASLRVPSALEAYLPLSQAPVGNVSVVVRTLVPPLSLAGAVRRALHEIDPDLPLARLNTLEQHVAASIATPRFYTLLLAAFAGLALVLAAIGVFGVLSFLVSQRTREIGIRVALGCEPSRVMRDVIVRSMSLAVTGLVIGITIAIPLSRALSSLLFETSPSEPSILLSVVALLALVAIAASYVPARRATKVDPLVALRSE